MTTGTVDSMGINVCALRNHYCIITILECLLSHVNHMKNTTRNIKTKLGRGAIEVNRERLGKLRAGEMEKIVSLIQLVGQNVVGDAEIDCRTVLLSYGNPSVVKVDLGKLSKLPYEAIRQELLKLVDMQRRVVNDEVSRVERALGR